MPLNKLNQPQNEINQGGNTAEISIYPTIGYIVGNGSSIDLDDWLPSAVKFIIPFQDGNIIAESVSGQAMYFPAQKAGVLIPVFAKRILSAATINGAAVTTTAGVYSCLGGL